MGPITRSTRFACDKWELLNLTLTLTEEINMYTRARDFARSRTRAVARMRVIWHWELFDTTPAPFEHRSSTLSTYSFQKHPGHVTNIVRISGIKPKPIYWLAEIFCGWTEISVLSSWVGRINVRFLL